MSRKGIADLMREAKIRDAETASTLRYLEQYGACWRIAGEVFYPDRGQAATEARRICLGCPVRVTCREYAIPNETRGFWGGMTEKERQRERRRRRIMGSRGMVA